MDHTDVLAKLPHRFPMLMVDQIIKCDRSECTAVKNISYSEPCFQGHFPGNPIFPGVLTIEALAQTCALTFPESDSGALPVFAGIERARFKKPVYPGDRLILKAALQKQEKHFYTFSAEAMTDETVSCEAVLTIFYSA